MSSLAMSPESDQRNEKASPDRAIRHDNDNNNDTTALVATPTFNLINIFKEMFKNYKWYLANYPVYTKSITSCTIAMIGEIVSSYVKARVNKQCVEINVKRVGIFGLYGLVCTGPMLHFWYTLLEYTLTVKFNLTGNAKILAKLLIDRLLWAPPFVLLTVTFLQFMQSLSPGKTADAVKKSFMAVFLMNQRVWIPGQFVNFACVPVELQVLYVNAVNVGWNTLLSMMN